MYTDLEISNTGDLLFEEDDPIDDKSQKISFYISKYKGQKLRFSTSGIPQKKNINAIKISFTINNSKDTIRMKIIKNLDELSQFLYIQLKDVLGEDPIRENDGSKLSMFKHDEINETNLKILNIYLQNFLSQYLTNPSVKLTPVIDYQNGYKQAVQIKIYSGNNLLLEYNLER